MEQQKHLHLNLKFLRKKAKFTIAELLQELNLEIPQNTMASYEDQRENTPKYELLKALLDLYNDRLGTKINYEDIHEKDIEAIGLNAFISDQNSEIEDNLSHEQEIELIKLKSEYNITLEPLERYKLSDEKLDKMIRLEELKIKQLELEITKLKLKL